MTQATTLAGRLVSLARAGDVASAIALGEEALARGEADAGLAMFVGTLCCRAGELTRGIAHLRTAVAAAPGEAIPRIELARALLSADEIDEAVVLAEPQADTRTAQGREMRRILAQARARGKRDEDAAALFASLVEADPADFESWRGLGLTRLRLTDAAGAVAALQEATRRRPTVAAPWTELASAHLVAQQPLAALAPAERAVALAPDDAGAVIEHARVLAAVRRFAEATDALVRAQGLCGEDADRLVVIGEVALSAKAPQVAEAAYRHAVALRPDHEEGWRGLTRVLERTNRGGDLGNAIAAAAAAGVRPEALVLASALALRAGGRLDEAEATLAAAADDAPDLAARRQLAGELADRRGDADAAFAAFSQANALQAERVTGTERHAAEYRTRFAQLTERMTPDWHARWPRATPPDGRRTPIFVFGFPRSGTTLIDTLLSGHPETLVLEEEPSVERMSEAAPPIERLPDIDDGEVRRLRDRYFAEVARVAGDTGGRLIVDKQPLGLGSTPLLHRVFPDAKFVFVERHPLDVVLSCFTMSAQMDAKVANFFDFAGTAQLYDRVLAFWQRCVAVLDIDVLPVRYERLIDDSATEMRRLAAFAGLDWDDRLLANQANAAARGYIGSPSYAQVTQPLYTRARGRWTRYRRHLEPILPTLRPWIDSLGYPDPDS